MPEPYLIPMSALNQSSRLLADKNGPLDRTKWIRMGDIVRSAMAGALGGMPGGPVAMGAAALGSAADTIWDQMYPGGRAANITLAELGGKGKAPPVPEGMVRVYRGQRSDMQPIPHEESGWYPERGRWFTTDEEAARWYGRNVHYVDLPEAIAHEARVPDSMLNKTGRLIPAEYANQAKKLK